MPIASETLTPAMPDFVRSLNALLKFARLYGLHHIRSDEQFERTWGELKSAIQASGPAGLAIGVSGADLVLNGTMLESGDAEKSLSSILRNAQISSIIFTPDLFEDSFLDFVKAFARSSKSRDVLKLLKNSFDASERGIRINQLRFVPVHPDENSSAKNWLRDPEKLAQALGHNSATPHPRQFSSFAFGEELLGGLGEHAAGQPIGERESVELLALLRNIGEQAEHQPVDEAEWKQALASLSQPAKAVFGELLHEQTSKLRLSRLDDVALVRLETELAIRCAIEQFESGAISPEEVQPLLTRLCSKIADARTALPSRKAKFAGAKIAAGSQTDAAERQFWASLSPSTRDSVLFSEHSWNIPPRNIQQCVKEFQKAGDEERAQQILRQYARCASSSNATARKRVAAGLSELAEFYAGSSPEIFSGSMQAIGEQLHRERDPELQSLLSAAFLKFSEHAVAHRNFAAVHEMLETLGQLEKSRPTWARSLRPRIGFDNRIPEFIDGALRNGGFHNDFLEVMRAVPQAAAEQLASRITNVARVAEREKIVDLAGSIGEPIQAKLRQTLELAPSPKAVRVVGLLSRLQPTVVAQLLPSRLTSGVRETHDEALRQLSSAGAPERGQMLMNMLDLLDSMILPMALDEVGFCGDSSVAPDLLRVADARRIPDASDFVRVKAIEALGRLRVPSMEADLLRFVQEKRAWRWAFPSEIRLAAAQALIKLDPERAPILISDCGLDPKLLNFAPLDSRSDRDFVRHRRHLRIRMPRPVPAFAQSGRGKCDPDVHVLSMEGGLLGGDMKFPLGAAASLRISSGMRPIELDVLIRFTRRGQAGFETVGMELPDRARLRSLLVSVAPNSSQRSLVPM